MGWVPRVSRVALPCSPGYALVHPSYCWDVFLFVLTMAEIPSLAQHRFEESIHDKGVGLTSAITVKSSRSRGIV